MPSKSSFAFELKLLVRQLAEFALAWAPQITKTVQVGARSRPLDCDTSSRSQPFSWGELSLAERPSFYAALEQDQDAIASSFGFTEHYQLFVESSEASGWSYLSDCAAA